MPAPPPLSKHAPPWPSVYLSLTTCPFLMLVNCSPGYLPLTPSPTCPSLFSPSLACPLLVNPLATQAVLPSPLNSLPLLPPCYGENVPIHASPLSCHSPSSQPATPFPIASHSPSLPTTLLYSLSLPPSLCPCLPCMVHMYLPKAIWTHMVMACMPPLPLPTSSHPFACPYPPTCQSHLCLPLPLQVPPLFYACTPSPQPACPPPQSTCPSLHVPSSCL